ncbi:MAG: aldehyde dehydrogenase family protein, partial [Cyclobacteriaceae bacterium]|nr:aldehyde dehydrogenase family protein [Cyclobacteriaceae bacterium]
MQFRSINPFDNQVLDVYEGSTTEQVNYKIEKTHQAYLQWKNTSFEERSSQMHSAAAELMKNKKLYSESITLEMGKPIKEAVAEIEKWAMVCSFYAEKAFDFLKDTPLDTPHGNGYIHYNPLGVVLAVMPWNFPFWQVFRFAAPALMAGNACVLKHASNVPKCALDIEKVFLNAGFPNHIFNTLLIGSGAVKGVIEHELVTAVTLTGSENAGKSVASIAGG